MTHTTTDGLIVKPSDVYSIRALPIIRRHLNKGYSIVGFRPLTGDDSFFTAKLADSIGRASDYTYVTLIDNDSKPRFIAKPIIGGENTLDIWWE